MKRIFIIILFCTTFSCSGQQDKKMNQKDTIEYFNINQTQFTFLVFEKSKIDSFFNSFSNFKSSNKKLVDEIKLLRQIKFETNNEINVDRTIKNYDGNSEEPDTSSFGLAMNVLSSIEDSTIEEYFTANIDYLFFRKCLPDEFNYKWHQSTLGHFEFNATFFAYLRENSKALDELIYGERGFWDEKLKIIFGEYIFNEINEETAIEIKNVIISNPIFEDMRFENDKLIMTKFLNQVIDKKWRMILIDWN